MAVSEPRQPDWDALLTLGLSVLTLLLTAGIALFPALMFVLRTARHCPDQPGMADLILVFGKRLKRGKPDEEYVVRLHKASQTLQDFSHSQAVLMGGSSAHGEVSEAEAGRIYLAGLGVANGERIQLEQESRHTLENLRNARDRLCGIEGRSALLVSNRYHVARCSLLADSLGLDHKVCAAEERLIVNLANSRKLLVEAFFVHWFKTGRYWARLTHNRKMLSRIT